jgi:hypothetical protein
MLWAGGEEMAPSSRQASSPDPRGKPGSRPSKTTAGERQTLCWREMDSTRHEARLVVASRKFRFARDSLLEQRGFELPVPP